MIKIFFLAIVIVFNYSLAPAQSSDQRAMKVTDILKEELALDENQYNQVYEIMQDFLKTNPDADFQNENLKGSLNKVLNQAQMETYNNICLKLNYQVDEKKEGSMNNNLNKSDSFSIPLSIHPISNENFQPVRDNRKIKALKVTDTKPVDESLIKTEESPGNYE